MIRHDDGRGLGAPRKAVMSPDRGSVLISLSARLIRSRSLAGISRNARCAALASSKSQFMLEVFETHALAARVLFFGAAHRLDFLRQRVLARDHGVALRYGNVPAERLAQNFGAGAVLAFAHAVEFGHKLRRQRYGYGLHVSCAHLAAPSSQLSLRPARN